MVIFSLTDSIGTADVVIGHFPDVPRFSNSFAQFSTHSLGGTPFSLLKQECLSWPFQFAFSFVQQQTDDLGPKLSQKSIKGVWARSHSLRLLTSHHSQMGSFLGVVRVLLLSLFVSAVVANNNGCGKPKVRREWRKLSPRERGDWISAVNVLILLLLPHR